MTYNPELLEQCLQLLQFLYYHCITTKSLAIRILNHMTDKFSAHRIINEMIQQGFLLEINYRIINQDISLLMASAQGYQLLGVKTHQKKPQLSSLIHRIGIQELCLSWNQYTNGISMTDKNILKKNEGHCDALLINEQGNITIALEYERTIKSKERYHQIIAQHLQAIKQEKYQYVLWVYPEQQMGQRLKKIIYDIKTIEISGIYLNIIPEKHHHYLLFAHQSTWLSLAISTY